MKENNPLTDKLPLAGSHVDGLLVLKEIPNQSSISSSLDIYTILEGVREVSMDFFTYHPPYSVSEYNRTKQLADDIKASKTISPLIIVEDAKGFYILEGGHRFDALNMIGIKSFPALVVKDLSEKE